MIARVFDTVSLAIPRLRAAVDALRGEVPGSQAQLARIATLHEQLDETERWYLDKCHEVRVAVNERQTLLNLAIKVRWHYGAGMGNTRWVAERELGAAVDLLAPCTCSVHTADRKCPQHGEHAPR